LVPVGPPGATFTGVLTGGNGRPGSPGQTLTYQFDVPSGLSDLDLNTAIVDTHYNLEGVLVAPNGQPVDVQSTVVNLDPNTALPITYTNTLQFFRRDPQAGRWTFVFFINDNTSGLQTALPFVAHIVFNGVATGAAGIPNSPTTTLRRGVARTALITITNTGNTTKDYFVDPRLNRYGVLSLGSITVPLPQPVTVPPVVFTVPPESIDFTAVAESMSPTVPISMDIANANGAAPYGGTGTPDIEGQSFVDPRTGNDGVVASSRAAEVVAGLWTAEPQEVGPFTQTAAPSSQAAIGALAVTQQFDAAIHPSSGDAWATLTGQSNAPYAPLTLAPGQSGFIVVRIVPTAAPGTTVSGALYVDTLALDHTTGLLITGTGDEVKAIPYIYTVIR
jgi:hypothetical protein